jgi:hypothetical protein
MIQHLRTAWEEIVFLLVTCHPQGQHFMTFVY